MAIESVKNYVSFSYARISQPRNWIPRLKGMYPVARSHIDTQAECILRIP